MLKMKGQCEKCQRALAADGEATICSFECTFCPECAASMNHICPNCGGELLRRPRRTKNMSRAALGQIWRRVRS